MLTNIIRRRNAGLGTTWLLFHSLYPASTQVQGAPTYTYTSIDQSEVTAHITAPGQSPSISAAFTSQTGAAAQPSTSSTASSSDGNSNDRGGSHTGAIVGGVVGGVIGVVLLLGLGCYIGSRHPQIAQSISKHNALNQVQYEQPVLVLGREPQSTFFDAGGDGSTLCVRGHDCERYIFWPNYVTQEPARPTELSNMTRSNGIQNAPHTVHVTELDGRSKISYKTILPLAPNSAVQYRGFPEV